MGMRKKLIELLCKAHNAVTDKSLENDSEFGMTYAEQIETEADSLIANGVTIPVRCKDCKHYDNTEGIQWCRVNSKFSKWGMDWNSFPEDGFCSYGEKRTDGDGYEK